MWLSAIALGVTLGLGGVLPLTITALLATALFSIALPLYLERFRPGYFAILLLGLAFHLVNYYWIPQVLGHFHRCTPLGCTAFGGGLFLLFSFQFALFLFLYNRIQRTVLARFYLATPLAWIAAEAIFPKIIPWRLGNPWIVAPWISQLGEFGGPIAVSFCLMWWGSTIAKIMLDRSQALRGGLTCIVSIAAAISFGYWRIQSVDGAIEIAPKISAGVVQGDIDPVHDRLFEKRREVTKRHQDLSADLVADPTIDLIIWPESAVFYDYYTDEESISLNSPRDPLPGRKTPLIFGGQAKVRDGSGSDKRYYNAAFLFDSAGAVSGSYRKQVLLPFAEYHPFRGVVPFFDRMLNTEDLLLAGSAERPLRFMVDAGEVRAAVAICYEDLIPEVFARSVANHDANLLINLTNDAWFLESPAAKQHFMLAAWRAIENRKALIRVTNNGVTALVDPLGRVRNELVQFEATSSVFREIPLMNEHPLIPLLLRFDAWYWFGVVICLFAIFRVKLSS